MRSILFVILLLSFFGCVSPKFSAQSGNTAPSFSLIPEQTFSLPQGIHRPEILITDRSEIILVVVQPEGMPGTTGQVKHQAYRFDTKTRMQGPTILMP